MKRLNLKSLVLFGLIVTANASANQLADKISDEVFDSLIGTYSKFLNSNILSEICKSPNYLVMNYSSENIRSHLLQEISEVAKQKGIEDYDANEVRELTELEFQAFQDGSRYGAFVARNYQTKINNAYCSAEIMQTIAESQKNFVKQGDFILKKRIVK